MQMSKKVAVRTLSAGLALASPVYAGAQGVTVGPGARIISNSSAYLVLDDMSLTNNGSYVGGVTILNGTVTSTVGGSTTPTFGSLIVNKGSSGIQLNTDINVGSILSITNGAIDINGYQIELGASGTLLNETTSTPIIGTSGSVTRTVVLNAPNAVNPGNIGVEITSNENLGITTITRTYETVIVNSDDATIARTYNIVPANDNNLDATLRFFYGENEIPVGTAETDLYVWKYSDLGSAWQFYGRTENDGSLDYVDVTGIDTMGLFTLGTNVTDLTPLAVNLVSFSGHKVAEGIKLHWQTSMERDNSHFFIERSTDGRNFITLGKIDAAADGSRGASYQFLDGGPKSENLYRLKIYDTHGSFTYSHVLKVNVYDAQEPSVEAYPNPASDNMALLFRGLTTENIKVTAVNVAGRAAAEFQLNPGKGSSVAQVDVSGLPSGSYIFHFDNQSLVPVKFVKR